MKINIDNANNVEKITAAINEAEGRATVRTITFDDILDAVAAIEEKLRRILPKKALAGLKFAVNPNAQTFPAAYNGVPMSTQFILERGSKAWFLVNVYRDKCGGSTKWIDPLNIENRKDEIIQFLAEARNWM